MGCVPAKESSVKVTFLNRSGGEALVFWEKSPNELIHYETLPQVSNVQFTLVFSLLSLVNHTIRTTTGRLVQRRHIPLPHLGGQVRPPTCPHFHFLCLVKIDGLSVRPGIEAAMSSSNLPATAQQRFASFLAAAQPFQRPLLRTQVGRRHRNSSSRPR